MTLRLQPPILAAASSFARGFIDPAHKCMPHPMLAHDSFTESTSLAMLISDPVDAADGARLAPVAPTEVAHIGGVSLR